MLKRIIITIWLIALFPSVCIAGRVDVKRLNKANWIYFETENFKVITDAKEKKALEIVRELEDFRNFLSTFFLSYELRPLSEKVSVVAANNGRTFKSLGMSENYGGLFFKGYGCVIFARCDGFRSSSKGGSNLGRSIVLHELVHLFLRNASSELALPLWYNEGIAEYFSTYTEKDGQVIIGDSYELKIRLKMIKHIQHSPIGVLRVRYDNVDTESLFKTSKAELNVFETGKEHQTFLDKFYARAFFVVHYMFAEIERTEKLYHYLYLLKKGFSIDESFKLAFKMTFSELDKEVNQYIKGDDLKYMVYSPGEDGFNFPDVEIEKQDITKRDALGFLYTKISLLSDDLLGDGNFNRLNADMEELYPGLIAELFQQLAENPENRFVLLRLAKTYHRMYKHSEAIDMCEKALLLWGPDASVLNNLAWLLVTVPESELRDPIRAMELAERAVAIERSPCNLDTLAEAYYVNGSTQKAIEIITEAILLATDDNECLKNQLKRFKEAEEKF